MMRFLILFVFYASSLSAQTIHYDIILWGNKIGSMSIFRTEKEDGAEYYELNSHLKAKVLWITRENTARMETVFKNGKMISSFQKEIEDGKVKRFTKVTFDGTQYNVDSYKGKRTFTEQPAFAVAPIYFKGLAGIKRIFYEAEGEFCNVEKIDDSTWQFKASDGTKNIYRFKNGQADNLEFHMSIATVKLVRVN